MGASLGTGLGYRISALPNATQRDHPVPIPWVKSTLGLDVLHGRRLFKASTRVPAANQMRRQDRWRTFGADLCTTALTHSSDMKLGVMGTLLDRGILDIH